MKIQSSRFYIIDLAQDQNGMSRSVWFLFNTSPALTPCGFRYEKDLAGLRIQKIFIFLMLSWREHWLGATAALGSQPTWEWTAVVIQKKIRQYFGRCYSGKIKKKMVRKKLNENNFRAKRILDVSGGIWYTL